MFLWYVGKGETLISAGDRFNVATSTVYNIITKCLNCFVKLVSNYIRWPSIEERVVLEEEFRKLAGLPGVIGALDGCHIPIKCETKQQDSYINRKFFKSINLQGICTASKLLTNIYVGFPGSAHDSRVFKNSKLYLEIENNEIPFFGEAKQYQLLGHSAYLLKTWLMTPDDGPGVTRRQKKFNYILSATRVVIEHVFGLLKSRWQILKFIDVNSIEQAVLITSASCGLHNFCLLNKDIYEEPEVFQDIEDDLTNNSTAGNFAKQKRNTLCDLLVPT